MKLLVIGRYQAPDMTEDVIKIPHAVVSITSPNCKHPEYPENKNRIKILQLHFDDFDKERILAEGHKMEEVEEHIGRKAVLITDEQAKQILGMVRELPEGCLVICQCDAGISRSAATAAALAKIFNGNDTMFFKQYVPNRYVYRKILETHYTERMNCG